MALRKTGSTGLRVLRWLYILVGWRKIVRHVSCRYQGYRIGRLAILEINCLSIVVAVWRVWAILNMLVREIRRTKL